MGRHADEGRGRGIAGWIIIVISVAVVVAILAVTSYLFVFRHSDKTAACAKTTSTQVTAGTTAAAAIRDAATAYNATAPIVRSACVTVHVTAMSDYATMEALKRGWPSTTDNAPALWLPDNPAALAALDAAVPNMAAGHPTVAVAWSPLVLAVQQRDVPATASLTWSGIGQVGESRNAIDLGDGRPLTLALPPVATSAATSYLVQSLLIDNVASPVTADLVTAHAAMIRSLAPAKPRTGDPSATTDDALAALAASPAQSVTASAARSADDAADDVTAVPVVEAQLARFDQYTADNPLIGVYPAGPTVGDALIPAPITASWTTRAMHAAASDFQAFLSSTPGQQILADHGWRTTSAKPTKSFDHVTMSEDVTMVPNGGPAVDRAVASALGQQPPAPTDTASMPAPPSMTHHSPPATGSTSPSPDTTPTTTGPVTTSPTIPTSTTTSPPSVVDGPVLTIIVDTSSGMGDEEDGTVLLQGVKKAIGQVIDAHITDRIGLWAYSDAIVYPPSGFPELVSTGPLDDEVPAPSFGGGDDGDDDAPAESRSDALADALDLLQPDGDRWAYGALMGALQKIPDAAVDGRQSRVLLIVSGVDETPGTPRRLVLGAVKDAVDTVRVDTIGVGDAVPVDAYSDIAHAGGGKYIPAPDVDKLGQQIIDLLSLGD